MDELQMYEARDIAKNVMYVDKNEREIDRYKLYVSIQANSKKKLDPKDIMTLPWDNKWLNKTEFEYNEKEDKEYGERADSIADMLNSGSLQFGQTNMMQEIEKPKDKNM